MIPISLKTIEKISNGYLRGNDLIVNAITTDTRKNIKGSLFVALIGNYFNAHDFVVEAVSRGAHALLLNQPISLNIPQVIVPNTYIAYSKISAWIRQNVKARVVALTGSSGKTTVKEMMVSILNQCGKTLYTVNNLNNHFGVPMTLMNLSKEHDYAVIEVGASHPGEIAHVIKLVCPESVLINNIAPAHLEGFGSLNGVAKAKSEIFLGLSSYGTAIINAESNDLKNWQLYFNNDKKLWRFSVSSNDIEFWASDIMLYSNITFFTLHTPYGNISIELPLIGFHNISNALAATSLSMSINVPLTAIQTGLKVLKPISGRLFPIYLSTNQLLLDDSYNANVGSMIAAIKVLSNMSGFLVLVVGDMCELGNESKIHHSRIGEVVKESKIDCVLSIGTFSYLIGNGIKKNKHFVTKTALFEYLCELLSQYENITILIKGSRSIKMNDLVQSLQERRTC